MDIEYDNYIYSIEGYCPECTPEQQLKSFQENAAKYILGLNDKKRKTIQTLIEEKEEILKKNYRDWDWFKAGFNFELIFLNIFGIILFSLSVKGLFIIGIAYLLSFLIPKEFFSAYIWVWLIIIYFLNLYFTLSLSPKEEEELRRERLIEIEEKINEAKNKRIPKLHIMVKIFIAKMKNIEQEERRQQEEEKGKKTREKIRSKSKLTLEYIDTLTGLEFEEYMKDLLIKLNYKNVLKTSSSGDFGIDITAIDINARKVAIQCKRYKNNVSVDTIQKTFAGSKYYKCERKIVVTTSNFTKQAKEMALVLEVEIWDRDKLQFLLEKALERSM